MIARMAPRTVEDRRRLRRYGRNAVSGSSEAACARLRANAASGPHRLRDVRHAVAGARQRDSRLPRVERRCARRRLCENAAAGGHEGRLRRRGSRRDRRPRPRLVGRHDRPRQGVRHQSLLRRQHESARRLPRHDGPVVHEPGDRQALRIGFSGHHRRRHGAHGARVPRRDSALRGLPRWPAVRSAACRRSSGRCCTPIRSTRLWPSRARTRFSRRVSPGTRSRATPSWRIPTGRAATITAPGAPRTRAWAWPAWSATSRIFRRSRSATSSAGGCSSRTTSATR